MKKHRNLFRLLVMTMLIFQQEAQPASPLFNGESAFRYLVRQTEFGPRNPGSAGHAACLEFLKTELEKFGAEVSLQPFLHYDMESGATLTMTNVIGSFYPRNSSRILLCAHWDTRPFADRDIPQNQNKPILGANDGASGVAVLLELSRYFQKNPPPVGVDVVFFDGEDYGREGELNNYCLGSRHFTRINSRFFPRFAILLDMIGDKQLRIYVEGYSQQYVPEVVKLVWDAAADLGVHQFVPQIGYYVFDDHVILNEAGIPTVNIIDFEYPDSSHRYWHTLQDTPDKCSPESLKAVGTVLMQVIYDLVP